MSSIGPQQPLTNPAVTDAFVPRESNRLFALFNHQEMVFGVSFALVLFGVTLLNPGFIAPGNLIDILYNSSYIAVAVVGMTMIILCGHIDISIGAAAGVCVSVAGKLATAGVPLWIVFPVTILTGGLIG